jgi:hypothetical protein
MTTGGQFVLRNGQREGGNRWYLELCRESVDVTGNKVMNTTVNISGGSTNLEKVRANRSNIANIRVFGSKILSFTNIRW